MNDVLALLLLQSVLEEVEAGLLDAVHLLVLAHGNHRVGIHGLACLAARERALLLLLLVDLVLLLALVLVVALIARLAAAAARAGATAAEAGGGDVGSGAAKAVAGDDGRDLGVRWGEAVERGHRAVAGPGG